MQKKLVKLIFKKKLRIIDHHRKMASQRESIPEGEYKAASEQFSGNLDKFEKLLGNKVHQESWRKEVPMYPKGASGWLAKLDKPSYCLAVWAGLGDDDCVYFINATTGESVHYKMSPDEFLQMFE